MDIEISSYLQEFTLHPSSFCWEIWVPLEHSYHQIKIFYEFYRASLKKLQLRGQPSLQTAPMFIRRFSDKVVEKSIARKFKSIHFIATCRKTSKDTAAQKNLTKVKKSWWLSLYSPLMKMSKSEHSQFFLIIFVPKYKFCLPLWTTPWKFWNAWKLTFEPGSLIRSKTRFAAWP